MADTLTRIFGPVNIASGTSTLFTGVTGHIYTFKHFVIVNNTGAAISVKLGIGGVTDALLILPYTSIDAGGMAEGDGLWITSGTETIQANAGSTGLTITASGLDQG